MRYVGRCHARPAERSGLLARSPREIISTCWSHPSTASAPTSHDVHEGGWTSERLWSIRCTGRLCSHCGWQSDPARSTASQRAKLTGRVAPESPMLTVRASLSVCRCHGPVTVFQLDRYQSGIDHSLIDLESGMVNWYLRIPLSSLILLSSSGAVFSRDPLHRTAPMLWKT